MKETALLLGLELLAGFEKLGKLGVELGQVKAREDQASMKTKSRLLFSPFSKLQ